MKAGCKMKNEDNTFSEEFLYDLSDFFKLFGDSTRLKIIFTLIDRELCVGDISEELGMSQSSISHQLKILRQNKVIKNRKTGKQVFYSLDDDHVTSIIRQGIEHLEHRR